MTLTAEPARHVAMLSRLHLSDDEVKLYAEQLGAILEHIEQLQEVNTDNVEPMIGASADGNVFRADQPQPSLPREAALQNAPDQDDEYFRVPDVIE